MIADELVEQTGSFVYLLLQPMRPRSRPSDAAADITAGAHRFEPGQMVAADAIRQRAQGGKNDCYDDCNPSFHLRLSDGSGWIPSATALNNGSSKGSSSNGNSTTPLVVVQEVKVERGIWSFYVDNSPVGQALRRHPIDSADDFVLGRNDHNTTPSSGGSIGSRSPGSSGGTVFEPMQKIYCDRKVVHPQTRVGFYRVQGTTGWVFDRRRSSNQHTTGGTSSVITGASNNNTSQTMLIEVSKVKTGLFCFQALVDMVVRRNCSTRIESATQIRVRKGQPVAVDIVRESSDAEDGEGPYLRLTDGSGWLYTHLDGVEMMKEIPVTRGIWELKVLNPPIGVSLRRHPLDCQARIYSKIYPSSSFIQADYLVRMNDHYREDDDVERSRGKDKDDKGITFYRVKGTTGWVFDRRGDTQMLELLTEHDDASTGSSKNSTESSSADSGWTPEFVRGVAATIENVYETEYSASDQVLTFQTIDEILVVVYCATRTVGIRPNGQSFTWHRNCSPKLLWEHMRKDLVELMMMNRMSPRGSGTAPETPRDSTTNSRSVEKEEEMRNDLLRLDEEVEAIQQKRIVLLEKIRTYDRERAEAVQAMKQQVMSHHTEESDSNTKSSTEVTIIHEAEEQHNFAAGKAAAIATAAAAATPRHANGFAAEVEPVGSTDRSTSDDSGGSIASFTIPGSSVSESDPSASESESGRGSGPRRKRMEVHGKRLEVRHRIMQLLELRSQETTEFDGAFADSYTLEGDLTDEDDEGEGFEVDGEGDALADTLLDDTDTLLDATTFGQKTLTFEFTL